MTTTTLDRASVAVLAQSRQTADDVVTTTLAELLVRAGDVLAERTDLDAHAGQVAEVAGRLAVVAGEDALAVATPTVAASLRVLGVLAARSAHRRVVVPADQAAAIEGLLAAC